VTNASGCVSLASGNITINSQPTAPSATSGYFNATYNDAIIGGTVNAHNASTVVTIQYGTTTSYGSEIAATPSPVSGNIDTHVSATITGLKHSTRYYYRIKAVNNCGDPIYSNGSNFTTAACPASITLYHSTAGNVAPIAKTVTYGIVETSLSGENKCWITKNLGATNQASSATDNTEAARGWFWQFNLKQGYNHDGTTKTPSTWITPPISESSDWISANDPCTILLGPGWRIPTRTEWINSDLNGGWNNYNNTYASVLKLHAAGELNYLHGSLWNVSSFGYFWSSNQYYQSPNPGGWYLCISISGSDMYQYSKAAGNSIRCLQD